MFTDREFLFPLGSLDKFLVSLRGKSEHMDLVPISVVSDVKCAFKCVVIGISYTSCLYLPCRYLSFTQTQNQQWGGGSG